MCLRTTNQLANACTSNKQLRSIWNTSRHHPVDRSARQHSGSVARAHICAARAPFLLVASTVHKQPTPRSVRMTLQDGFECSKWMRMLCEASLRESKSMIMSRCLLIVQQNAWRNSTIVINKTQTTCRQENVVYLETAHCGGRLAESLKTTNGTNICDVYSLLVRAKSARSSKDVYIGCNSEERPASPRRGDAPGLGPDNPSSQTKADWCNCKQAQN
jgi:hypothetical protein